MVKVGKHEKHRNLTEGSSLWSKRCSRNNKSAKNGELHYDKI